MAGAFTFILHMVIVSSLAALAWGCVTRLERRAACSHPFAAELTERRPGCWGLLGELVVVQAWWLP